jgi:hypothetical protein
MQTHVDDKGKYFTNRVTTRGMPVILSLNGTQIRGELHLKLENRLKDELNGEEQFIAITHAQVMTNGNQQYETNLIVVNKNHIDWIFPSDTRLDPIGKE